MRKMLKNQMFRNFISTLLFGAFFLILFFIWRGSVDVAIVLRSMALYFAIMTIFNIIVPKLIRIAGRNKKTEK